jgi:hypothetical protein
MSQRVKRPAVAVTIGLAAMAGCKTTSHADSAVKVTNGIPTDGYPAVVYLNNDSLEAACTGTFVSDTTLLTAAHCINNDDDGGLRIDTVRSLKSIHVAGVFGLGAQRLPTDLAIIIFPPGTGTSTIPMATKPPAVGDSITIIGYGRTIATVDKSVSETQAITGDNQLQSAGAFLFFTGQPGPSDTVPAGQDSASGDGDSGGPLLIDGKLAGTCAVGSVAQGRKRSFYINLQSPQSCALLRRAQAEGADIPALGDQCGETLPMPQEDAEPLP